MRDLLKLNHLDYIVQLFGDGRIGSFISRLNELIQVHVRFFLLLSLRAGWLLGLTALSFIQEMTFGVALLLRLDASLGLDQVVH